MAKMPVMGIKDVPIVGIMATPLVSGHQCPVYPNGKTLNPDFLSWNPGFSPY